jgi:hypothetical protein
MKNLLMLSALAALPMLATPSNPCPSSSGGNTGGAYITAGGLCNVVITYNSNGSIVTTDPNLNPYDGADDQLVGIVNNSGHVLVSQFLNGGAGNPLFGFDGDGACSAGYESAANCVGALDPNGYGGPHVLFSGINGATTSGTVNFGCTTASVSSCVGIASGATAWFSLEEPPSVNGIGIPEPTSIVLFGTLLLGAAAGIRRRVKN